MKIHFEYLHLTVNRKFDTFRIIKFEFVLFVLFEFVSFHFQQELTAKILHLENPVKFINISKEGYLGLWTTNLNLEKTYSAAEESDDNSGNAVVSGGQGRRRAGMWITDAVYMTDAHKLVLASTSRDLRFFTISSETFLEDFALFGKFNNLNKIKISSIYFLGVKNVPTCLDYFPSRTVRLSIEYFN